MQTSSAWDGLDTLAQFNSASGVSTHASLVSSQPTSTFPEDDDWGLGDFAAAPTGPIMPNSVEPAQAEVWDIGDFTSATSTSRPTPPPSIPKPEVPRSNSPGDFDFGEHRDSLLDDDDDSADEDDILGALSKPIDVIPKPTPPAVCSHYSTI